MEARNYIPPSVFTSHLPAVTAQVSPITCYQGLGPFNENFTTCETEGRCVKLTKLSDK